MLQSQLPGVQSQSYKQQVQQYNIRNAEDYAMDEEESLISTASSHKSKRDDIISSIINKKPNAFYSKHPQLSSQWYADIVIFSGLYNMNKNDYSKLAQTGFADLVSAYPVDSDIMTVIVSDYELPDLDQVIDNNIYIPSKKAVQKINYKDKNYVKKRLSEIALTGSISKSKKSIFGVSKK